MSLLGKKILGLVSKPRKRDGKISIPSYEQAVKIGILYTYEGERKEESIDLLKQLLDQDKHIEVLCLMDNKEIASSKNPCFYVDELNHWGKIKSEIASQFLTTSYDYLIHLDFELNDILKSFLNRTQAKCRVGYYSEIGGPYYELMIGINKSVGTSNFAEQAVKYIKSIR
ncbi:MAG TPA: hypothetical protein VIN11_00320 [Roseivirga sp.]